MSLSKIVSDLKSCRLIALDPASHSLAWSVFDLSATNIELVDTGKIDFSKSKEISTKLSIINKELSDICKKYSPDRAAIEQSVYIQNFQSSRIISYIIGFSWGVLIRTCSQVVDINPLIWKNKIGYKNVGKKDKESLINEHGEKNIQKRLKDERKDRVKVIIEEKLGFSTEDSDINDSIGIGLWYALEHGYGAVQR
jgi:Holliday junction resolvasome RuvABC endonuclease subunit